MPALSVTGRTGLGVLEVGVLAALAELGALAGATRVKTDRVVRLAAGHLDVGPSYVGEVLRDLGRPWRTQIGLVDIQGNIDAEVTYTESRLTRVGAMALACERDALPRYPSIERQN